MRGLLSCQWSILPNYHKPKQTKAWELQDSNTAPMSSNMNMVSLLPMARLVWGSLLVKEKRGSLFKERRQRVQWKGSQIEYQGPKLLAGWLCTKYLTSLRLSSPCKDKVPGTLSSFEIYIRLPYQVTTQWSNSFPPSHLYLQLNLKDGIVKPLALSRKPKTFQNCVQWRKARRWYPVRSKNFTFWILGKKSE